MNIGTLSGLLGRNRNGKAVLYIKTPHRHDGLYSVHCEITDNMIGCFPSYQIALDYKSSIEEKINEEKRNDQTEHI